MVEHSRDLRLEAARYALGDLSSDELTRIADALLIQGVYLPSIGELATGRGLVMEEAGPLFEYTLRQLGVDLPSREEAIWALLRHHIRRVANGDVAPREGLQSVLHLYDRAGLHGRSQVYVGDSHGIQGLIGAYWQYQDVLGRPFGEALETDVEGLRALDDFVLHEATGWIGEHGA